MTESEAKGFIQGKLDCMKKCDVFDKEGNISDNDCDNCEYCYSQGNFGNQKEAFQMAIKALEQEPKMEQFAKWVVTEIFDDMWEYNKDSFAEIACRKLAKLGIVRANGDEWELVESQESEEV